MEIYTDVVAVFFPSLLFHLPLQLSNTEKSISNSFSAPLTFFWSSFYFKGMEGGEELRSIVLTILFFISFLYHTTE